MLHLYTVAIDVSRDLNNPVEFECFKLSKVYSGFFIIVSFHFVRL